VTTHADALWTHAEMLAARAELSALRRKARQLDKVADNVRVTWSIARDYRDAASELLDRCQRLRLDIEAAEARWQ